MSDERHQIQQQQQNQHSQQLQRRHNCCRLCLAPDNECISILNSFAADKEPLASKINTCVSIKISSSDNLSLRICHACISYLNSWQSFKNRCLAAQTKQRSWLEVSNKSIQSAEQHHQTADNNYDDTQYTHHQQHHHQHHQQDEQSLASSILEGISTLKKRKSLTVYVSPKSQQTKQQQEKVLQKQQLNVAMPLIKRHYTKHKYNKSQQQWQNQTSQTTTATHHAQAMSSKTKQKSDKKQSSANQQSLLATCSPLQQAFVIPAIPSVTATVTSCTITASAAASTATATTCVNTPTNTTLTNTAMVATSSSRVETVTASTSTAVATGLAVRVGSSDECLGGASNASSSAIACTSAVQQLRLFRRYSYNVNVSYTAYLWLSKLNLLTYLCT